MNILLMANWGIGLEILKALYCHPLICNICVVSRYNTDSEDPWENAVYRYSTDKGCKTYNENKIDFDAVSAIINDEKIDLTVTHAYMRILPEYLFNAPLKGSINIHPSLLPKYRGPSPTQWVLKNKESHTGFTCHYIDQGMDTGDIIYQTTIKTKSTDTIESIIDREKKTIPHLIDVSLSRVADTSFIPQKQDNRLATYAPRKIGENA